MHQNRIITPVLPVNETKMSDNEAFQAFLSRNEGEADDSFWKGTKNKINID